MKTSKDFAPYTIKALASIGMTDHRDLDALAAMVEGKTKRGSKALFSNYSNKNDGLYRLSRSRGFWSVEQCKGGLIVRDFLIGFNGQY